MDVFIQDAIEYLTGKVPILFTDDDRMVLTSLGAVMSSPLFRVTEAETYEDALAAIRVATEPWACWVLDIDLGENRTGIDIMKAHPLFPFVIILSGLRSMRLAAEATTLGALSVVDKDPGAIEQLREDTCAVAALGYLLGGVQTKYLSTYQLLRNPAVTTTEIWAERACVTKRQLFRICELHKVSSPSSSISTYHAIYFLLRYGDDEPGAESLVPELRDFYHDCVKRFLRDRGVNS